jgi:uncharacterized DUF497 family protein
MEIEFDPAKDTANRKKHGLSLAMASELEWDDAHVWPDTRFFYDEPRFRALVSLGEAIFHAAFVERGDSIRIIGLRKASKAERTLYVEHAR